MFKYKKKTLFTKFSVCSKFVLKKNNAFFIILGILTR